MARAYMPVSTVDFSTFPDSDGLPMAEDDDNRIQMFDLIIALGRLLNPRGHYVTGNMLLYYNPRDGRDHFSPDVFVALAVGAQRRRKWQTWIEGKFPEVVFEILSISTRDEDFGRKAIRYHELGAREYYLFDVQEGHTLWSFQPDHEGRWPRRPVAGPAMQSPLLGLELRVVDGWLRVIDPATGQPVPSVDEEHDALLAAELHAEREHAALMEAQARAEREWLARQGAEAQVEREQLARQEAEMRGERERLARQEAEAQGERERLARQEAEARAAEADRAMQAALAELARIRGEQG